MRTAIYMGFSRHLYYNVWRGTVAMISARAHINNNLYSGPTVEPCRVTTRVTVLAKSERAEKWS